jgi:hypothetical protein
MRTYSLVVWSYAVLKIHIHLQDASSSVLARREKRECNYIMADRRLLTIALHVPLRSKLMGLLALAAAGVLRQQLSSQHRILRVREHSHTF